MNEEQIKRLIRNDSVGEPDFRVEDLLNYAYMLKSAQFKTRQNSFSGFFGWIFSMKSLGMKAAVASILLAFVMLKPEIDMNSGASPALDSAANVLVVDSTFFQSNAGLGNDSVF